MKYFWDSILPLCKDNCWLKANLIISFLLLLTGFLLPPTGVIDNSVLLSVGELFAFSALGETVRIIQAGHNTKLKLKELELEVNNVKNIKETDEDQN